MFKNDEYNKCTFVFQQNYKLSNKNYEINVKNYFINPLVKSATPIHTLSWKGFASYNGLRACRKLDSEKCENIDRI